MNRSQRRKQEDFKEISHAEIVDVAIDRYKKTRDFRQKPYIRGRK